MSVRKRSWKLERRSDPRRTVLRQALTEALRRAHIGAKKLKLDKETRWQVAGEAVEELRWA